MKCIDVDYFLLVLSMFPGSGVYCLLPIKLSDPVSSNSASFLICFPFLSFGKLIKYILLNRHEFEQTLGDGEGQGSLVCCSLWAAKSWT